HSTYILQRPGGHRDLHSFPTRRSSDLWELWETVHRVEKGGNYGWSAMEGPQPVKPEKVGPTPIRPALIELPHTISCSVTGGRVRSEEHTSELQSRFDLVCRLLLEKKKR